MISRRFYKPVSAWAQGKLPLCVFKRNGVSMLITECFPSSFLYSNRILSVSCL